MLSSTVLTYLVTYFVGAMTFSITTLSIMTLGINGLYVTFSIMPLSIATLPLC